MKREELVKLLQSMSLSEKIDQLVQLNGEFFGTNEELTGPAAAFRLTPDHPYKLGSVLGEHGAENIRSIQDKIIAAQPHHIPAVFMSDVIHGYKTAFPVPVAQGCSFNPDLTEELCCAAAKEAAAGGIHVTFSPMADLSRDSRWGRCMESTGEDPYLNAKFAESAVKGYQGNNIGDKGRLASCVKHFAAYGAMESALDYGVTEVSERTLREEHLPSYKAAVDAGVSMVMTAFNTIDRIPCTVNRRLMKNILRDEMGFDGLVITDYNAIGESMVHGVSEDKYEASQRAFEAGCDIDMVSDCYINHLEKLIADGIISEADLDKSVMKMLELKNKLGLFENPYKDGSAEAEKELLFCEEHKALSRRAAEQSIVLLKNNGILPLAELSKTVVIGSLAESAEITGTWALFADKNQTVTFRQALSELYPDSSMEFLAYDKADDKMLEAAKNADNVILCLGEDQWGTGESRSKTDIALCNEHRELFSAVNAVCQNIVTVLFGGRPLAVPYEAEHSCAVIMTWLPGSVGCLALADIIYGKVNPSGKLSMSFPYCTGQLPMSYSAFSTGRPKPDGEGFFPFRSNYMDAPNTPLYPFGHGLSYTSYEYSPVTLSDNILRPNVRITASVTVTNTGSTDGMEAVQLYVRDIKASVIRPLKQLKGFKKIKLSAGESQIVAFDITEDMLKFYDADMNYVCEKGDFSLWIGGSSTTDNITSFCYEI